MANSPVPQFAQSNLALVQSMASQISAAAARYGVPAEAIAGALAQEQFDQTSSLLNEGKAFGSGVYADLFLSGMYAEGTAKYIAGLATSPQLGASDLILNQYNAAPNAFTVGSNVGAKLDNPLLVDYGPGGMKFQNAIGAILNNPDDPAFAPYLNNLYSAGVALQSGSDPALLASSMAVYLRQGLGIYQSNMTVNGDPTTGINAWNSLDPSLQNALLVQFYKQGPTPDRVLRSMTLAEQNGVPYVSQIGVDGAGATYLANQAAVSHALAGGAADFSSRWGALDAGNLAASVQQAANSIDATNKSISDTWLGGSDNRISNGFATLNSFSSGGWQSNVGANSGSNYASDPTSPIAANGLFPGNTFINSSLLNTQGGQMAFPLSQTPNGLPGTTENWQANFGYFPSSFSPTVSNDNSGSDFYSGIDVSGNTDYYAQYGFAYPVVLDLTGQGINITQLGSSDQFHDMTGDSYQNQTAWAGAGNGVLAIDLNGSGNIIRLTSLSSPTGIRPRPRTCRRSATCSTPIMTASSMPAMPTGASSAPW